MLKEMIQKRYLLQGLAACLVFISSLSFGAPGVIKDRPLFLGFSVKPNIYFVVDDSGSMAWDVTKSTDAATNYPATYEYYTYRSCGYCRSRSSYDGSCTSWRSRSCSSYLRTDTFRRVKYDGSYGYINYSLSPTHVFDDFIAYPYSTSEFISDNASNLDEYGTPSDHQLELCPAYNVTAFDKSQDYVEWVNHSPSTVNVSNHYYAVWNDSDNSGTKGVYDRGECSGAIPVSSMSAKDQQNYRNWFTYYRSRQNVAKKAISEVVQDSEARMGLATINSGQKFSVSDMEEGSNKQNLLSRVFDVPASGGTPLRSALDNAGQYFSGSASPIQSEDEGGSCQQNYTIMMTDGYWNSDGSWSGPGNYDGSSAHKLVRASDRDNYSNTLADVALKYYATDLKPLLADEVPIIEGVDENEAQHMVTFTVAFGVNGQIVPNSSIAGQETDKDGMPLYPDQPFKWPEPKSNQDSTIDDVRHAAWNGRGLYLNASDPESLINALSSSIDEIESRTGTASALAFNATSFRTDSKFYYAQFTSGSWGGELIAQELSSDLEAGEVLWKASDQLDALSPASRKIFTYDPASSRGVNFSNSTLPSVIRDDLTSLYNSSYTTFYSSADDFVSDAVDYLRGDRSNEGASAGQFRDRSTALGDIINSTPVYVSGAASNWPAFIEPGYISYMRSVSSLDPVIFVGANDGMLHAFNADSGNELFAYVPYGVASTTSDEGLHYLVNQEYNHRYYVDGTVEVADAYVGGQWKRILIGGLGAGGKSFFAIDVSDTSSMSESKVLWEIELADLGLTYPQAKIAKMNDGTWVAIVGNGYHNSTDGRAKIFVLDLATGALLKTFDTGYGALDAGQCLEACNGMSKVTIRDLDGDGAVDFIYAGDVQGNIWAINTTSDKQSEWVFDSQITYLNGVITGYGGSSIEPVFVTEGRRPVTTTLVVVDHPNVYDRKTWPNQLLFVGSGQFLAEGDHDSTDTEHVYAFMHMNGQYELSVSTHSELFSERVIKESTYGDLTLRSVEPKVDSEAIFEYGYQTTESGVQQKMGWYLPLPASGERVIHDPLKVSDFVIFNTLVPESDPCKFGASGFTMAISLLYGANPETPILDFNNDGEINADDEDLAGYELTSPPAGLTQLGNKGIGQSTFESPEFELLNLYGNSSSRLSWEDLK